jgi:hypothetical protein
MRAVRYRDAIWLKVLFRIQLAGSDSEELKLQTFAAIPHGQVP